VDMMMLRKAMDVSLDPLSRLERSLTADASRAEHQP
jgi:hypothetical protein